MGDIETNCIVAQEKSKNENKKNETMIELIILSKAEKVILTNIRPDAHAHTYTHTQSAVIQEKTVHQTV